MVLMSIRKIIFCFMLAFCLLTPSFGALAINNVELNLLLPIDTADGNQYDFALTDGAAHVVYAKSGNVYYASATKDNLNWNIRNLGPGSWPTIASNKNNDVVIAFANNGSIYEAKSANNWNPTPIFIGISGAKPLLSSPFFSPGWQMSIEGCSDGDGRIEIFRAVNSGSGWGSPALLYDGRYEDGSGNYYAQASIAAFSDYSYSLALQVRNWGGKASWSDEWAGVIGPGTSQIGVDGLAWETDIRFSRRAVSCISEDGSAKAAFACSIGGKIYAAINEGSGWNWILYGYGSGCSAPAVSWTGAVYTDSENTLRFITSNESGIIDSQITYLGDPVSGFSPLTISMEDKFFLFKDGSDMLYLGASINNYGVVPEPASMVSLIAGGCGFILTALSRRRQK